jgi:hypothetical protein
MLRLQYFLSGSERKPSRYVLFCSIFFLFGFVLAFSSVDIPPFVFIHETGHFISAKMLDVRLEKTSSSSYIMYLEKGKAVRNYVRVLRAGYTAELLMWYVLTIVLFMVNVRRVRHVKDGFHSPLALVPGYTVGLFSKLKGTTDIRAISELLHRPEDAVIRRFICTETAIVVSLLCAYIFGFMLYVLLREKRRAGI